MPDGLNQPTTNNFMEALQLAAGTVTDAEPLNMALRLIGAGLAGWVVSLIATRGIGRNSDRTLPLTLVLMSVLIAMATQIIGDNVARAFSLVGALSIVRFRTAVPDSRDVAFVLASVVVGMAIGAGQWMIAGCGLVLVGLVNHLFGFTSSSIASNGFSKARSRLSIQTDIVSGVVSEEIMNNYCRELLLISATTARKGTAMTHIYQVKLRPEIRPEKMISEIKSAPGVSSVSWSQNFDRDE